MWSIIASSINYAYNPMNSKVLTSARLRIWINCNIRKKQWSRLLLYPYTHTHKYISDLDQNVVAKKTNNCWCWTGIISGGGWKWTDDILGPDPSSDYALSNSLGHVQACTAAPLGPATLSLMLMDFNLEKCVLLHLTPNARGM